MSNQRVRLPDGTYLTEDELLAAMELLEREGKVVRTQDPVTGEDRWHPTHQA